MRLLVFDESTMELEVQYLLDEDLVDLVVVDANQLIGLCEYCEQSIRRYRLP
ncbi:MAG: hypothetical protein AAGA85_06960 [Bacteroidota bacterium]